MAVYKYLTVVVNFYIFTPIFCVAAVLGAYCCGIQQPIDATFIQCLLPFLLLSCMTGLVILLLIGLNLSHKNIEKY